jgi:hypothetical protein
MNCYKDSVTGLSLSFSCQNPPEVALPFTVMMFAVCDLAVWYVFRKDELGKLSDVTKRFTVAIPIAEVPSKVWVWTSTLLLSMSACRADRILKHLP